MTPQLVTLISAWFFLLGIAAGRIYQSWVMWPQVRAQLEAEAQTFEQASRLQ